MKIFLIGRFSVGKSSLFNKITKKRNIVMEEKGTTRDILREDFEFEGRTWTITDSAGMETQAYSNLFEGQKQMILEEMRTANVIFFVVDGVAGVTPMDWDVLQLLRENNAIEKVILLINKLDKGKFSESDFYELGLPIQFAVSAMSGTGLYDALEACKAFEEYPALFEETDLPPKVAIVGRPNAGKSTLLNSFLKTNRCLVSDEEFTTRDPIKERINTKHGSFDLIDTAGIRFNRLKEFGPVYLGMKRTLRIIEQSDVVLFVLDSSDHVYREDQRIMDAIKENKKACIRLMNKMDILPDREAFEKEVDLKFRYLDFAPRLYISAKTSKHTEKIPALIQQAYASYTSRQSTHQVNKMIQQILTDGSLPMNNRKILYITQADIKPPTFVFFVNKTALFDQSYINFFSKRIIESLKLVGTPVDIIFKGRRDND
ncbi:MAG: ribosome biogenesis GTPase Der [Caldisericia bacterium]|nr:ribosome biogenesis GTPase Der [Caldisericia bacterium]